MCSMCECYVCGCMPHEENDYCDGDNIVGYYDEQLNEYVRYMTPEHFEEELNG